MDSTLLLAIPVGALAGLLAGLFGIGGGLILVSALVWVLPMMGVPESAVMHAALATALGAITLTSLSSARAHAKRGSILWPSFALLVPGMLLGGWLGARVAGVMSGDLLGFGVAAFCLVAAWEMWRPRASANDTTRVVPRHWLLAPGGAVIGLVSALVGIGGGSMTVPLLVRLGARPVHAVGTSAACGFPIALAAAFGYAFQAALPSAVTPQGMWGHVHVPMALALGATSIVFAPMGAALAHRLPGLQLRRAFAVLLVVVGIQIAVRGALVAA